MKNTSIITSIPEFYAGQDFYETTGLFIDSVRRFHPDVPVFVIIPPMYKPPVKEYDVTFISTKLHNSELLFSNVLNIIPKFVETEKFIYFTTENVLLKTIPDFEDINVVMTKMEDDNSYFEFEKTIHEMYYKKNTNEDLILEYMIAGETNSPLWEEFYNLSADILKYIKMNKDEVQEHFNEELYQYILPSADLAALNILLQQGKYTFKNFPSSFISMHPGLTEKYNKPTEDSIFFQYGGFWHNNVDKFVDIPCKDTKHWLMKKIMWHNPTLAVRLA